MRERRSHSNLPVDAERSSNTVEKKNAMAEKMTKMTKVLALKIRECQTSKTEFTDLTWKDGAGDTSTHKATSNTELHLGGLGK